MDEYDLKQLPPPPHIVAVSVYLAIDAWTIEEAEKIAVDAITVRILSVPENTDPTRLMAVRLLSRLGSVLQGDEPERI